MRKKALCVLLALACSVSLCGCWDYVGLDELTVVTGISVDKDKTDKDKMLIGFEIADFPATSGDAPLKSLLLEGSGYTMTQAVRETSQQLRNNPYFGGTEIVVISKEFAQENGLQQVIDPLLRDNSIRDNLTIVISGEERAAEIITPAESETVGIVSVKINEAIGTGRTVTSLNATYAPNLDQLYTAFSRGADFCLPILKVANKETRDLEMDGLAVFSDGNMIGELEQEKIPYFLLAAAPLKDGSFNLFFPPDENGGARYVAFVNRSSKPKITFAFDGETFHFHVNIKVFLSATEFSPALDTRFTGDISREFADATGDVLSREVEELIKAMQSELGADLLDFGGKVRSKEPKIWKSVEENWRDWYKNAQVHVTCEVTISDTGIMQQI